MPTTQSVSVMLPYDLARKVQAKVVSGEYASESKVISDGLLSLFDRDAAIERWIVEDVAPTYDAAAADPHRALSPSEAWILLQRHMDSRRAESAAD